MNLRDLILASPDLGELKPINVPEWKGTEGLLFLRQMTAKEQEAFEIAYKAYREGKPSNVVARTCASVLVDKVGQRIFSDADADALATKSGVVLDRVFGEWLKLSALTKETADAEKKD